MKRAEAIALLKEITADGDIIPTWVSLENGRSGGYELRIKSERSAPTSLKPIVKEHDLSLKEINGFWIIYRKRVVHKRPPRNLKLIVLKHKSLSGMRRIAVVDLDKSGRYPLNFVCTLPSPASLGKCRTTKSPFLQLFGEGSLEVAKALLKDAIEEAHDSEEKVEFERRLKVLEIRTTLKTL